MSLERKHFGNTIDSTIFQSNNKNKFLALSREISRKVKLDAFKPLIQQAEFAVIHYDQKHIAKEIDKHSGVRDFMPGGISMLQALLTQRDRGNLPGGVHLITDSLSAEGMHYFVERGLAVFNSITSISDRQSIMITMNRGLQNYGPRWELVSFEGKDLENSMIQAVEHLGTSLTQEGLIRCGSNGLYYGSNNAGVESAQKLGFVALNPGDGIIICRNIPGLDFQSAQEVTQLF